MATERELERLVVRLVGDSATYRKMLRDAEQQVEQAAKTIEKAGKRMEGVRRHLDSFAASMKNVGQRMTSVGRSLSLFVTAPIVAMGAAAIKAGSSFQSGFAGVRKTVNATEAEFATLRQGFKDMAATTPIATTELLKIGELGGQLGIATGNLLGFTKTIAEVGVTTNLTVDEAAEAFARFANITGLPQKQLERIASAVVALGASSAASERDIVSMAMRLAGAGTTVGMTAAQVVGFATALSSVGLEAEAGGTAFSRLFLMIQTAVATGDDSLKKFAQTAQLSVEEFSQLFRKDAAGAVLALLKAMSRLGPDAKVLALKDLGLDESVRMTDAILRASNATDLFGRSLTTANTAFEENTALAKEAAERFKTFDSAMTVLWNNVKLLGGEFFEVLEPSLREIVDGVKGATEWFRSLSPEMKLQIAQTAALAAAIGPLLVALGLLATALSQIISLLALVTTGAGLAKLAFAALGAVIAGVVVHSVYMLIEAYMELNKQIAESQKLQNRLLANYQAKTEEILTKGGTLTGKAQKGFLVEQLRIAENELEGLRMSMRRAGEELAQAGTQAEIMAAKQQLKEMNELFKEQERRIEGIKDLMKRPVNLPPGETVAPILGGAATGAGDRGSAEDLAKQTEELTKKLQEQAATLGMASTEAQIYALQLRGVKYEELATARAASDAINQFDAQNKLFEKGQDVAKALRTPLEVFADTQKELEQLFLGNAIGAETYQKGMEKAKKELDDAGKSAETAAGRFDAAGKGTSEAISRMMEFQFGKGRPGEAATKFALPERPDLAPALAEFKAMNRQATKANIVRGGTAGFDQDMSSIGFSPFVPWPNMETSLRSIGGMDLSPNLVGAATAALHNDLAYLPPGEFRSGILEQASGAIGNTEDAQVTLVEMAVALNRLVEIGEAELEKPGLDELESGALQ